MTDPSPIADADEISRLLGPEGRAALVDLAWAAVRAAVEGREVDPDIVARGPRHFLFGAFVTLTRAGRLRGCIGMLGRTGAAADLVADAGRAAATEDPRFAPVTPDELDEIELEISLLTPLEWLSPSALPDAVRVGEHGLLVELPPARGLLLPQVAVEWEWDAGRFLDETCRKAGLPRQAWREGARVARFGALVLAGGRAPSA